MLDKAIYTHLAADSGIAALVSTRIYPLAMPQEPTFPAIVFTVITEPRSHTMEGRSVPNPYVQIDCFGTTNIQANEVADAVVTCLDAFRGNLGTSPDQLKVSYCAQRGRRSIFEGETREYRISLDFSFWYGS